MNTYEGTQDTLLQGTLSIQEAAVLYGVTEKTIRRRIKAGTLRAAQHPIVEGFEWRVYPETTRNYNGASMQGIQEGTLVSINMGTQGTQASTHSGQMEQPVPNDDSTSVETPVQMPEVLALVQLVDRLQRDNQQLSGQVGFLQARVQEQERTIALLMAPKEEPEEDTHAPPSEPVQPRSWWYRLFNR